MIIKPFITVAAIGGGAFFLLGLKSQKGEAKGLQNGKLAKCPSAPNCVSSEEGTQPEKRVEPLPASLDDVKSAIVSTGGVITSASDHYVSATYMSKVFKFVDDVEVRAQTPTLCHIRSASRVGYSDRGVNRRRVATIRDHLTSQ